MDMQESETKLQALYEDLNKEVEGKYTSTGLHIAPEQEIRYVKSVKPKS